MLSTQFPHLPSTDNKAMRWLPQVFIAFYLLMSLVWAFSTEATWDDDCPGRAYNALHAFSEPIQFISPWNRPLFILVFSIPVQFGFWTIPVLMSGITALSAWALYKGVAKLGVPNAAFVLPLFLFQTFPFVISHNALTEPMAMALIAAGFWALVEKKWWLFGLFGGLVVLARLELVLLLPIWAYLLVRERQYLPILLLGFPFLLWNLAGGLITGDWAYVFSATLGAAGEESRYGQTPWGHYFMRYIYVIGPVVLFLFLLGMLDRLRRRQFAAFLDLQFLVGFLAYVWIGAMVAAGNSAGFLRNLIPMTPLVALLALEGMNVYISTAESKAGDGKGSKYASWLVMGLGIALTMACATVFNKALKMHMLFDTERSFWANTVWMGALAGLWLVWNAVKGKEGNYAPKRVMAGALAISGLAISFTLLAEPPGANDSRERQIMGEVGDLIQPELAQGAPLYVNHIWYFWTQGEDPKAKTTFPVTVRELDAAPEGALVLWDLHYSPRLAGNVRHDYFDAHREWTELLRYRTVDGNFMAMVFRKGKAIHKQAVDMSNAYLAQHQQLAAAWSAAGNVHMRWGDFPKAESSLSKATQLDPSDPDAWFSLGLAQLSMRKLPQAEHSLTKASKVDPLFPSVWFHLGTVHSALGQQEQAISDLNRCIDLKPDYANAYFARGATFGRMGRLEEAIADFSATLQLEPTHKQAIFNRGATYAIMRRHDLAVVDLQLALKAMPGNADGWLFLGRSQLALQNNAAACASFQKASALNSPKAADLIAKHCVSK